jgi:transposase
VAGKSREERIAHWLDRIERSRLSPEEFVAKYGVPFSLPQYYRYRAAYTRHGIAGLIDGRKQGNHRIIHEEAEGFIRGYASAQADLTRSDVRRALEEQFGIKVTSWGLTRCLQRLGIQLQRSTRRENVTAVQSPHAGMELIVALAWHFGWPQAAAQAIRSSIARAKRSKRFAHGEKGGDLRGRNRRGQFTARYNRRPDIRRDRFASVQSKRASKVIQGMSVALGSHKALQRKCLAVLVLPYVTNNGEVRTVNKARGRALKTLCGYRYRQSTLTKFLSELKYLGASCELLGKSVAFWQECWGSEFPLEDDLPLLCYYVDGNTKALWSKKRVKKNKVTMLGRVMGCLEQVFVHDSYGRPLYFETFSGHAPLGEYVLSLFEKIEKSLEGPGPRLPVNRAIVLDGASNSVRTLRAFVSQKKYHYITSLDDNQWNPRKVCKQGRPRRYRHGAASLRDCEIELEDSQEKGYLFRTRAIKIDWDRGKTTYLATSLPKEIIGPSVVVKSYFDRWPDEELSFRVMKAVGCLHRVAGYGKQRVPDERVRTQQNELALQIKRLKTELSEPLIALEEEEARIARLIPKERRLRVRSDVVDGERILPKSQAQELRAISRTIAKHQRRIALIRKEEPKIRKLERAQREWLRLQGKDTVYKVDVELDQIMTYFRVSLINLYTYLSKLMGGSPLSLVNLLHTVLFLSGRVEETATIRHVTLEKNEVETDAMDRLQQAIERINAMNIEDDKGRRYRFALE